MGHTARGLDRVGGLCGKDEEDGGGADCQGNKEGVSDVALVVRAPGREQAAAILGQWLLLLLAATWLPRGEGGNWKGSHDNKVKEEDDNEAEFFVNNFTFTTIFYINGLHIERGKIA